MGRRFFSWTKHPEFQDKLSYLWDRQYGLWQTSRVNRDDILGVVLWPDLTGDNNDKLLVELTVMFKDGKKDMEMVFLPDEPFSPAWEIRAEVALSVALQHLLIRQKP